MYPMISKSTRPKMKKLLHVLKPRMVTNITPTTSITPFKMKRLVMLSQKKTRLNAAENESIKWLGKSQEASKKEYKPKKNELEEAGNSIMMKFYQQAGDTPSIY
ncbi:unnamed protein product [Rhizopus stolonifer]